MLGQDYLLTFILNEVQGLGRMFQHPVGSFIRLASNINLPFDHIALSNGKLTIVLT